jgi:hypothetical protein
VTCRSAGIGRRSRLARLSTAVALAALLAPAPAVAGTPILLPSVRTSLTPGPPLAGANVPTESLFPRGMTSVQRVLVRVDAAGKPVSVAVVQRLMLHRLGDYSFAVGGPVVDVEAAPGSDSEPGLRHDAILWSGFSSGKKVLAAQARLRVGPASALLPLRVSITRAGTTLLVRGENTSAAPGPVLVGPVSAQEVAKALGETRRALPLGRAAPDLYVTAQRVPVSQSEPIAAPLDVRGELGGVRFRYRLGDGGPMRFAVRLPHAPRGAKLRLVVTPVPPSRLLAPPGAATWTEAVRRGRLDRSRLLELASRARLAVARALQYQTFLANPDASGRSSAVYIYETAVRRAAPASPPSEDNGTSNILGVVLLATIAAGVAAALVVLWAHS